MSNTATGEVSVDTNTAGTGTFVIDTVYNGVTVTTIPFTVTVVCPAIVQKTIFGDFNWVVPGSMADASTLDATLAAATHTYTATGVYTAIDSSNRVLAWSQFSWMDAVSCGVVPTL